MHFGRSINQRIHSVNKALHNLWEYVDSLPDTRTPLIDDPTLEQIKEAFGFELISPKKLMEEIDKLLDNVEDKYPSET